MADSTLEPDSGSPLAPSRPSIEKMPLRPEPFESLPDEIIEQILRATDPDGFASLVLLNRKWRAVSQQAHIYHHHLAQCPSYAAGHSTPPSADDVNLPLLRRLFAREVKRNLFEAYLRPSETIIKLVSTSISSSSCPGGEGMQFSPSPLGHHILAYNSARIYVIDVRGPSFEVAREFKILRRPVSACIKDDRSLLAVLSTEMQVDLYDLKSSPPQRTSSIILDNSPRTISLSPCGSVLAAAYEGGIEVSSLKTGALSTDRRAVKCDGVDNLTFSFDGTQLLGTTIHSSPPSTVIITAPYYDPGSQLLDDNISAMWTNSILFPNTSRDCSHAVLLQDGNQEEAAWTFTYDRSFETFRAVRIDDLRNGTTYFTGPTPQETSQTKLLPCTPSAATHRGEVVSAGFQGKEIWIYGIPEDLDAVAETASSHNDSGSASSSLGRRNSAQGNAASRHTPPRAQGTANSNLVPQWQLLCDKHRNTFVAGRKISELSGLSNVKWVSSFGSSSFQERLVAGARGVCGPRLVTDEEDINFVDGGRLILLDFDYGLSNGKKSEITIEVGTEAAEVLEEEQRDMETEVAIVRRRTVMQRRNSRVSLLRTATTGASRASVVPPVPPLPQSEPTDDDDDPLVPRAVGRNVIERPAPVSPSNDDVETASFEEQEALDLPYANASPRSGTTLRRAATAVAVNRRYNPTTADGRPIEYRRADGRREHPHESDADNWVPPPPPYQKEDPGDLPAFLRAEAVPPMPPLPAIPPMPSTFEGLASKARPETVAWGGSPPLHERRRSTDSFPQRPSHQRTASDSTTFSRRRIIDTPRPMSTPSIQADVENLYDVSPPDSPRQSARPTNGSEPSPQLEHRSSSAAAVSRATTPGNDTAEQAQAQEEAPPMPSPASVRPVEPVAITGPERTAPEPPALGLQIPSALPPNLEEHSANTPRARRLSNSSTWPAAPRPFTSHTYSQSSGYPYSAPPLQIRGEDMAAALPPPPTSSQMDSLNKRISQGNPRRLSGGMYQIPRVPVPTGTRSASAQNFYPPVITSRRPSTAHAEPDQPLIISTPGGISGAFDPPSQQSSMGQSETPILAPIPRHPRPSQGSPLRPTVERLETIYSTASSQGRSQLVQSLPPPPPEPHHSILPSWLNRPQSSYSRTSPSIRRRRSRAERSAAKNMEDARKSGWSSSRKKNKKKSNLETASTTVWADAPDVSPSKQKKCVVM
ncbi:hypothetical protein HJFPF1_00722 [Paramyrothecium foliicola]|nr:hypothetical protein HJFPF1_00722 [Paramyrothecium foliicola]